MATELFNNLISSVTTALGSENTIATKISEKLDDNKFASVFDNVKSKYISRESSNRGLNKEDVSQVNTDTQTIGNRNTEKEIEQSTGNVEETNKKEKEENNLNVNKDSSDKVADKKIEDVQADSNVKDETSNQKQSSQDNVSTQEKEKQVEQVIDDGLLSIENATLNNMLLSNVEIETPISQESEIQEVSEYDVLKEEKPASLVPVETVEISPESSLDNSKNTDELEFVGSNASSLNSTKSSSVDSKDTTELGKTEEVSLLKDAELSSLIDREQFLETEVQVNEDILVKVDDVIEQAMDEVALESENEMVQSTEISQEVIDNMDVTIRSVEKTDVSNNNAQQGGHSFDSRSNAKEEIIRMTLENNSQPMQNNQNIENVVSNTATNATSAINATATINLSSDLSNINTSNIMSSQTANTAIQQPMSEMETSVLNQISAKLTSPQDGASSKVQIILQPENLGKVSVEIANTKDGVTAKLIAESPQIKEILDKSIESLKNSIASQGVNVNNISVKVEETTSSQNANMGFEQEQFDRESAKHFNQQQSDNTSKSNFESLNNSEISTKEQIVDATNEIRPDETTSINENGSISVMV